MAKKKSKKGKVAGGVGAVAVLAIAALFAGKGFGFGFGGGSGTGTGTGEGDKVSINADVQNSIEEEKESVEEKQEETGGVTVSIEVKQGQYFIDGAEKSLTDIEALLTAEDVSENSFVLVNNFAAAKAWDEVMALFTEHGVDVVEQ